MRGHPTNGFHPVMTQVRIISGLSKYPTELVRDLRARGYEVETSVSRQAEQEAAELEITVDQCSPDGLAGLISSSATQKDVYIVASSEISAGKIRSIGMVVLSPAAATQTSHTTAIPAQVAEIYAALLRGRNGAMAGPVFANSFRRKWLNWRKLVASMEEWFDYSRVQMTKRVHQLGAATAQWNDSRKLRRRERDLSPEADLVPSLFSLSSEQVERAEVSDEDFPVEPVSNEPRRVLGLGRVRWRGAFALGAVALVVSLVFWGFSHSASADKKDSGLQAQAPVSVAEDPAKTGTEAAPEIKETALTTASPTVSRTVAKPHASDDRDSFEEVVVRHFTRPAASTAKADKDGIKRRVVVD